MVLGWSIIHVSCFDYFFTFCYSIRIFRVLQICTSRYGRDEGLALLEKTGMYLGLERCTVKHMPIDVMRGEIFHACRS